jgi:Fe-S oxidoreductase
MYQLMPSMIALGKILARFEDSPLRHSFGMGRLTNRALSLSRFTPLLVKRADQQAFDAILRDIAFLLAASGVEFGYLYEEEMYAGALAHDEGLCDTFEQHVLKVDAMLRRHGVQHLITVDPHTTNILRSVYPKIVGNGSVKVQSYLEVLAERNGAPPLRLERSAVIHDSCVYARHEGIIDEPRKLLGEAGIIAREPEYAGTMTFCCGGPIESLFPKKARSIADTRLDQLAGNGGHVITMCPVCLVNLRDAAAGSEVRVDDIAGSLTEAYSK